MSLCVLGAYVVSANMFGPSSRYFVVGEIHCVGNETELLECSHDSIGHHRCGGSTEDTDTVAIVCGMPQPPTYLYIQNCYIAQTFVIFCSKEAYQDCHVYIFFQNMVRVLV